MSFLGRSNAFYVVFFKLEIPSLNVLTGHQNIQYLTDKPSAGCKYFF